MSVYVGIDVHRKRSQVAVIDEGGEVLANRNVPNGVRPILSVIGELPAGTPTAFEAAFGWGWLLELLESYGFEPHMVHPLQCKAHSLSAAEERQGRCRNRRDVCGPVALALLRWAGRRKMKSSRVQRAASRPLSEESVLHSHSRDTLQDDECPGAQTESIVM